MAIKAVLLVRLLLCSALPSAFAGHLEYRFGQQRDMLPIATRLLREKMNPLFLSADRFLVCRESDSGALVGFGQIRQLAKSNAADPARFDAPPGSGDVGQPADDDAWDDFDRAYAASAPESGLDALLPWSARYRELAQRAAVQRERRRSRVSQAETEAAPLWELASVYVGEQWRGRGVGSELVRRLCARHVQRGGARRDLYLITLEPTCGWYEGLGFSRVERQDLPPQMGLEVAAGEAVSWVLGNRLVCMRGTGGAGEVQ